MYNVFILWNIIWSGSKMALSVIQLLPSLYSIQKKLESYSITFGSQTLYIDPVNASSAVNVPSKVRNTQLLNDLSTELTMFASIKHNINNRRKTYNVVAWTYGMIVFSMFVIIPIILLVIIVICAFKETTITVILDILKLLSGFFKPKSKLSVPRVFMGVLIFLIATSLVLFIAYVTIEITTSNVAINDKLNQTSLMETNSIAQVVNMFNVTGISSDGETMDLLSNYPAMVYFFAKSNPNKEVNWSGATVTQEVLHGTESAFLGDAANQILYPFINGTKPDIDPFALKKEIQQYDLFGQLARLDKSIAKIRTFMLRVSDDKYQSGSMDATNLAGIRDAIVNILINTCTILPDLQIVSTTPTVCTQSDCYEGALNDGSALGATYNPVKMQCSILKKLDASSSVKYVTSDGNMKTMIKNDTDLLKVGGGGANIQNVGTLLALDGKCATNQSTMGCVVNLTDLVNSYSPTTSNVDYATALAPGVGNATTWEFNTTPSVILKNHPEGIQDALIFAKDVFITRISDYIVSNDATKTFMMSQDDIDYIQSSVQLQSGNTMVTGNIVDILTQVPATLIQRYTNITADTTSSSNTSSTLIPFERFIEKMGGLDSKAFIIDIVYSYDEIRSVCTGIKQLNDSYPVIKRANDTNDNIIKMAIILMFTVVTCGFVLWVTHRVHKTTYTSRETQGDPCFAMLFKIACEGLNVAAEKAPEPIVVEQGGEKTKTKVLTSIAQDVFLYVTVGALLACIMVIIKSTYIKKSSINTFNNEIIMDNGMTLVMSSQSVIENLFDDCKNNRYNTLATNTNGAANINALRNEDITIDPFEKEDIGDCPTNLMFEYIVKHSTIDSNVFLKIGDSNHMYDIYLSTVAILTAYDNCNNIMALGGANVPFPLTEVIVFGAILIICIYVIALLISDKEIIENYKRWIWQMQCKRSGKVCESVDPSATDEGTKATTNAILKLIICCFIVTATVLFCNKIYTDSTNFINTLYSTGQFEQKRCYK
jgi:hypothetical protein